MRLSGMRQPAVMLILLLWGSCIPTHLMSQGAVAFGKVSFDSLYRLSTELAYSDPGKAREIARSMLDRARQVRDTSAMARAYSAVGVTYWAEDRYVQTLREYILGRDLATMINDSVTLGILNNNIGLVFLALESPEESEVYLHRSRQLRENLRDTLGMGRVYLNLGLTARQRGVYDTARLHLHRSQRYLTVAGNAFALAQIDYYLGQLAADTDSIDVAERHFRRALRTFAQVGNVMGIPLVRTDLARLRMRQGRYDDALSLAHEALREARASRALFPAREAYRVLHQIHALRKEYDRAYAFLQSELAVTDSLRDETAFVEIARLELIERFDQQRKEEQLERRAKTLEMQRLLEHERGLRNILLLGTATLLVIVLVILLANRKIRRHRAQVLEQSRQLEAVNQRLRASNATRDRLLAIIGHDLRGPLASISQITDLLRDTTVPIDSAARNELLEAIQHASHTALSTFENLLNWAQSQSEGFSVRLASVDIAALIDEQVTLHHPYAMHKHIQVEVHSERPLLWTVDRGLLSAVLRNLINNALKFTPEQGRVTIRAERRLDALSISVEDTGIGFMEGSNALSDEHTVFAEGGVSVEGKGTGLGLELCRNFTALHKGTLEIHSNPEEGSTLRIRLPELAPEH